MSDSSVQGPVYDVINGLDLEPENLFSLLAGIWSSSDAFSTEFEELCPNPEALFENITSLCALPGGFFLVSRERMVCSGFVQVHPRRASRLSHTAELTMGVSPAFRGRGTGTYLLEQAFSRLRRERIIEILYLMVRSDNTAALRLYERAGFTCKTRLERDTRIGNTYRDGLLMRKFILETETSSPQKRIENES
jgi:RimJ/RimL family protein N-acetyltransferase